PALEILMLPWGDPAWSARPPRVLGRLGQEPVAKGRDLGKVRGRLRTNDPIGVRRFEREREWTHEASRAKIPRGERGARERDPLPVDGGVDRHARLVEDRPALRVDAGDLRCL